MRLARAADEAVIPLGDPALSLDRKPAWAVSGVEDEQVTQNEQHVFVGHGESVRGQVPKFGCAYFQTYTAYYPRRGPRERAATYPRARRPTRSMPPRKKPPVRSQYFGAIRVRRAARAQPR